MPPVRPMLAKAVHAMPEGDLLYEPKWDGYRCIVAADACASYFQEFHAVALRMIAAQGGIFGWVATSADLAAALSQEAPARAIASQSATTQGRSLLAKSDST